MEILVSSILALVTLAFVLSPVIWPAPASAPLKGQREKWLSLPQLELDRALGKIDEAEFNELEKRTTADQAPKNARAAFPDVEAAILSLRRARLVDRSLESEILIQRARSKSKKEAHAGSPPNLTS